MIIKLDVYEIKEAIKLYLNREFGKTPADVILRDATDGYTLYNVEASCRFEGGE